MEKPAIGRTSSSIPSHRRFFPELPRPSSLQRIDVPNAATLGVSLANDPPSTRPAPVIASGSASRGCDRTGDALLLAAPHPGSELLMIAPPGTVTSGSRMYIAFEKRGRSALRRTSTPRLPGRRRALRTASGRARDRGVSLSSSPPQDRPGLHRWVPALASDCFQLRARAAHEHRPEAPHLAVGSPARSPDALELFRLLEGGSASGGKRLW